MGDRISNGFVETIGGGKRREEHFQRLESEQTLFLMI